MNKGPSTPSSTKKTESESAAGNSEERKKQRSSSSKKGQKQPSDSNRHISDTPTQQLPGKSSIVMPAMVIIAGIFIFIFGFQAWKSHIFVSASSELTKEVGIITDIIEENARTTHNSAMRIEQDISDLHSNLQELGEEFFALKKAYQEDMGESQDLHSLRGVIRDEMARALDDSQSFPSPFIRRFSDHIDSMASRYEAWEDLRIKAFSGNPYFSEFKRLRAIFLSHNIAIPKALEDYSQSPIASSADLLTGFKEISQSLLKRDRQEESPEIPSDEGGLKEGIWNRIGSMMHGFIRVDPVDSSHWDETIGHIDSMISASQHSADTTLLAILSMIEGKISQENRSTPPKEIESWLSDMHKRIELNEAIRQTDHLMMRLNNEDISLLKDMLSILNTDVPAAE